MRRQYCAEAFEPRLLLTNIYQQSFEGVLGSEWTLLEVHPDSRVEVRDLVAEGIVTNPSSIQFTQNGNNHALTFDSTAASGDSINDLGVATVAVDLTGYSDAVLTFHQFELDDENTSLPDQHSLTTNGDGLAVSRNGTNWYTLRNLEGRDINRSGDGRWQLHEYDLGMEFQRINAAFGAGLNFNDEIQFKFSQYDNTPLSNDGWAIDEFIIADESGTFDISRPRGAFHRFNLSGEDDDDYYYRAAVYGEPDANTPIVALIHGSNGDVNYDGYAWRWHNFVSDPANGIDSVILVMPAFVESVAPGRFNTPIRYNALSWNNTDNAAADLALLETVNTISSTGIGNGSEIYLWGFSAGGQFTGRFTAAHPDRVAAAVVGGPASQILPDDSIGYIYGTGAHGTFPAPSGVSLNATDYVASRIMYWVGQDDSDPNHSQLTRNATVDSIQGITRRERSLNQFEAMHQAASELDISPSDYEFELYVAEDHGHGWSSSDIPVIAEFLFREHDVSEEPIKVHSRIVRTPSTGDQQNFLPQSLTRLNSSETFFAEFWLEAPSGVNVNSGVVDMFFDTSLVDVVEIQHGTFNASVTGTIDENAGRIRNFGGTFSGTSHTGRYQLFGRVELQTTGASLTELARLKLALQRNAGSEFSLTSGQTQRTDFQPFESVNVGGAAQGLASGGIQGHIFADGNSNGTRQSNEEGLADYFVQLRDSATGQPATAVFQVEPDDSSGNGAYLTEVNPWVTLSPVGTEPINSGIRAGHKGTDESSTGSHVFSFNRSDGTNTQWVENLRSLRMDFSAPTKSVSIDVIAKLGDDRDVGRLEVYSADGTLLQVTESSDLADAAFETVTITRTQADIAFAIATGVGSNRVRLDNLSFESVLQQQTNDSGEYRFDQILPGNYFVFASDSSDFSSPATNSRSAAIAAGTMTAAVDVAIDTSPPGSPDLVAVAFNAVSDHVPDGKTDVTATVENVGTAAAGPFLARVMLSLDGVRGNAEDIAASTVFVFPALNFGTSHTSTLNIQLDRAALYAHAVAMNPAGPANTVSAETPELFLVIDPNNQIAESNESNNSNQGHLIDSDDITYFPWDQNGQGTVTPLEALSAIHAVGASHSLLDYDGNGIVTPLEALATLQRIGHRRNDSVVGDSPLTSAQFHAVPASQTTWPHVAPVTQTADDDENIFETDVYEYATVLSQPLPDPTAEVDAAYSTDTDWLSVI